MSQTNTFTIEPLKHTHYTVWWSSVCWQLVAHQRQDNIINKICYVYLTLILGKVNKYWQQLVSLRLKIIALCPSSPKVNKCSPDSEKAFNIIYLFLLAADSCDYIFLYCRLPRHDTLEGELCTNIQLGKTKFKGCSHMAPREEDNWQV